MRPTALVLALIVVTSSGSGLRADEDVRSGEGAEAPEQPGKPALTSLPALPDELHAALQDRRFDEALKQIDAELAKEKPVAPDYLLYLKGRALTELERYDESRQTFDRLGQQHAGSRWAARGRFGRADTFARQRDYRAAGEIYQVEARRLATGHATNSMEFRPTHLVMGRADQVKQVPGAFPIYGHTTAHVRHDADGADEQRGGDADAAVASPVFVVEAVLATDEWRAVRQGDVAARFGGPDE